MKFKHYGSEHFVKGKFIKVRNADANGMPNKPKRNSCLWASPIREDGTDDWGEWCENEQFSTGDNSKWFIFKLSDNAKLLTLNGREDLDKFVNSKYQRMFPFEHTIAHILNPDFEKISEDYDAMLVYMTYEGDIGFEGSYYRLYGWDVDTLLVFNPDIIIEIESSEN